MGALSRRCRNLADGRNLDDVWRWLLDGRSLLDHCRRGIRSANYVELEEAHRHLKNGEAAKHAAASHRSLLNCDTGEARLGWIQRAVACGIVAQVVRTGGSDGGRWLREAFDLPVDYSCDAPLTLATLVEQLDLAQQLAFQYHGDVEAVSFSSRLIVQFAKVEASPEHSVSIPLVLMNQQETQGLIANLRLQCFSGGKGRLLPCPRTRLAVEVHTETLNGIQLAWELVSAYENIDTTNVDVLWSLDGSDSIIGRSADATFGVALYSLLRGLTIERDYFVSASLAADGRLGMVNGISESTAPKLDAISDKTGTYRAATLFVATENALHGDSRSFWESRNVQVCPCEQLSDVLHAFGRQLRHLEDFLQSQIDWILAQASERFGRKLTTVDEFTQRTISLHVARGVTADLADNEPAAVESPDGGTDAKPGNEEEKTEEDEADSLDMDSLREEISWSDYRSLNPNRTVLLGDPGFGKTTLMYQLIAEQCVNEKTRLSSGLVRPSDASFSLYLAASDLASRLLIDGTSATGIQPVMDCIVDAYAPDESILDAIENGIANGQCQLCIDALDEVTDSGNLESFLNSLLAENPLTRVILTSRRTGYAGPPFELPMSDQLELMPLTLSQIREAIHCWFDDQAVAQAICRQVDESAHLHDVLRSPILLNLATRQIRNADDAELALPSWRRRSELYDGFVTHAIEQIGKGSRPSPTRMEKFELRILLRKLSLRLWELDAKRSVWPLCDLHREIKRCVGKHKLWGLRRRFPDLLDDLHESGLLVPIQAGDDESPLMFLHRTIAEYLAGDCLAKQVDEDDEDIWDFFDAKLWDPAWRQVLLFFAGCLKEPPALLSRLLEDGVGTGQDDLLRHRLLFAAACLPELEHNPKAFSSEIAERVCHLARNVVPFRRSDSIRDAVLALLIANPMLGDEQFRDCWFRRVVFAERLIPELGTVADSSALWMWLFGRLKRAVDAGTDSPRRGNLRIFYLSRAILSVRTSVNISDLLQFDPEQEIDWARVQEVVAAADYQPDTVVQIEPALLQRIADYCLGTDRSRSSTANRIVERFPELTADQFQGTGIIKQCCDVLDGPDERGVHKRAFKLLAGQGPAVGTDEHFRGWISCVPDSLREHALLEVVEGARHGLRTNEVIEQLTSTITKSDVAKALTGFRILLTINANELTSWFAAIERVLDSNVQAIGELESFVAANPSRAIIRFVLNQLETVKNHARGVRLTLAYAQSLGIARDESRRLTLGPWHLPKDRPELAVQLAWLDKLVGALQDPVAAYSGSSVRFDDPLVLEWLLTSDDLNRSSIGRVSLILACRFRPSETLAAWFAEQLCSQKELDESLKECLAAGLVRMRRLLKDEIRYAMTDRSVNPAIAVDHRFADVTSQNDRALIERLQIFLGKAKGKDQYEVVRRLTELPLGSIDDQFADVLLNMAKSLRTSYRELASQAITKLGDSAITEMFVERLFSALSRESSPGPLTRAACEMARRCPEPFMPKSVMEFFDEFSALREHAGLIVAELGDAFASHENLDRILDRAFARLEQGGDEPKSRLAREAVYTLERLLSSCSNDFRPAVFASLIRLVKRIPPSVHRPLESTSTSSWLINQLSGDNPEFAFYAALYLSKRTRENRGPLGPPVLVVGCKGIEEFTIKLPAAGDDRQRMLDQALRLAWISQQHDLRFFVRGDEVIVRATHSLSKVSAENFVR